MEVRDRDRLTVVRKCPYCGRKFETVFGGRRFCSRLCYEAWRYTRIHRVIPDLSLPPDT